MNARAPMPRLLLLLAFLSGFNALAQPAKAEAAPPKTDAASPTLARGSVEKDPVSTCLACHMDQEPKAIPKGSPFAPVLPRYYSAEWYYYNVRSETHPPYDRTPDTDTKGHGVTHYDWDRKAMIEIYEDVRVNRFPSGHKFPCRFLHVGDTAYYMTFDCPSAWPRASPTRSTCRAKSRASSATSPTWNW